MGPDAMILVFWMLSFKPTFSLSSFPFIKRLFSSSSLSVKTHTHNIMVVSSAYLRLLIFLLAILIPAYASSSLAFLMMCSAYKLNKQGDNIQPWCTPLPIWNQSVVPCPVLTVAFWPVYRFLKIIQVLLNNKTRYSYIYLLLKIFIWLHLVCIMWQSFSCGMWDLVPWPGTELRHPAWRAQSLSHWTNRGVLYISLLICIYWVPHLWIPMLVNRFSYFLNLTQWQHCKTVWQKMTIICFADIRNTLKRKLMGENLISLFCED